MDRALLIWVNDLTTSPAVAAIGTFLSSPWMLVLVTGPVLAFLLTKKRYLAILAIALSMGLTDLVTARLMKPLVGRTRPCRAITGLHTPDGCGPGESFPSGHAAVSFAFLLSAAPAVPYGWVIFLPLATGVAGSRVLLGVHYPSDIAAGAGFGALIGYAGHRLRKRREKTAAPDPT